MKFINNLKSLFKRSEETSIHLQSLMAIEKHNYLAKHLFLSPKYENPLKLNKYEFQAFSQNGEDGIIEEIFKRIGTTNKYFIEFGVENGLECNSLYLLFQNWKGLWIDGSKENAKTIEKKFKGKIESGQLAILDSFITRENIEHLFAKANCPKEPDFLSIDIDRNDYYVWEVISHD
jgi:hypothetical protein